MKYPQRALLLMVVACVLGQVVFTTAAEKAPVQFISLSVQILPATAEDPLTDLEWTAALSSIGRANAINHELMLAIGDHDYSHETYVVWNDPFGLEPIVMPVALDIPPFADTNDNGMDDFFDPSVSVDGITTAGRHPNPNNRSGEDFSATWNRAAGQSTGTVVLNYPFFGLRFEHSFQLAHYAGEYSFDRSGTNLQGTLSLTNALSAEKIAGPLSVRVVNTNTLALSAATWNNTLGSDYLISTNFYDGRFGTNFYSYWILEDGFLGTGEEDYVDWIMVIGSGDANNNGQLDLVETGAPASVRPSLSIVRRPNGYDITITGTAGRSYRLESTTNVAVPTWPNHQVVSMTSATQVVTIPADGSPMRFFRLREQ